MKDLLFQRDEFGRYIGSPYDNFLRVNHLPAGAAGRAKRRPPTISGCYQQVLALKNPIYITPQRWLASSITRSRISLARWSCRG